MFAPWGPWWADAGVAECAPALAVFAVVAAV